MTKLSILYQKVDALKPRPNNPRTHSDKQIKQLKSCITRFKFTNPVLVDDNNIIIAGHVGVSWKDRLVFLLCQAK